MQLEQDDQQIQIVHEAIIPIVCGAHMNTYIIWIIMVMIIKLIKWSCRSPSIILTIEDRVIAFP